MNYFIQVPANSSSASTPAIPIQAPPTALVEWSVIIAAVAWFGRQVWSYFIEKETGEASLMKELIGNLKDNQSQLLKDNRQAQVDLVEQIQLKESISKISAIMSHDLQRHLISQTAIYGDMLKELVTLNSKIDALHKRLDSTSNNYTNTLKIPLEKS